MPTKRTNTPASLPAVRPEGLDLAGDHVVPLQYFHNSERHPKDDGPWNDEADKIGWRDEGTGSPCIILRERDGTLSGFVGVDPDHPLYGFEADAVPSGIGICVHGRLNYAKPCEANVPEPVSVCHVPSNAELRPTRARIDWKLSREKYGDRDLWWFGFTTNHEGDFIPINRSANHFDGIEVYRDQAFVYREVIKLASQLSVIVGSAQTDGAIEIDGPIALLDFALERSEDDGQ